MRNKLILTCFIYYYVGMVRIVSPRVGDLLYSYIEMIDNTECLVTW